MSEIENGIVGVLEASGSAMHRVDIQGALPVFNPASIEAALAKMARAGTLKRARKGYYELPQEGDRDAVLPVWGNPNAAPFARVLSILKEKGPLKRSTIKSQLAGVKDIGRVVMDMVYEGNVHIDADGRVQLGPNPRRPATKTNSDRWSSGHMLVQGSDETPDTPSEKEREDEATSTSDEPEAVATPNPAGDAPDERAASESPAAAIEPPPADPKPPTDEDENMAEQDNEIEIEDVEEQENHAEFILNGDGVRIVIDGEPSKVLRAVAAIDAGASLEKLG